MKKILIGISFFTSISVFAVPAYWQLECDVSSQGESSDGPSNVGTAEVKISHEKVEVSINGGETVILENDLSEGNFNRYANDGTFLKPKKVKVLKTITAPLNDYSNRNGKYPLGKEIFLDYTLGNTSIALECKTIPVFLYTTDV